MNKSHIANRMLGRMGLSKAAAAGALDAVFETLGDALANTGEMKLPGYGTFSTRSKQARAGWNPRTTDAVSKPVSTTQIQYSRLTRQSVSRHSGYP